MKRIRIGNDVSVSLRVLTAGEACPLEGRNLRLVLRDPKGDNSEVDFSAVGNTIGFVFPGREQKHIGRYGVELWENEGRAQQAVADVSEAFVLVQRSDEQGGNDTADLRTELVELSLELDEAQACLAALFASGRVDDSLNDDVLVIQRGSTVHTTTVAALQGALKERINEVERGLANTLGTIDSAIKSSNSYTDTKVGQAAGVAKEYTEELVRQAVGDAKGYTDEQVSQAVGETKDYTDEKVSAVANGQLKQSVKDNGNIVLSNANGESKEFMPATPSGDPMHYAYVAAGAVYNANEEDIQMVGVFGDSYVHKAHHWHLNELGDITNEEMREIYAKSFPMRRSVYLENAFANTDIRTNISIWDEVQNSAHGGVALTKATIAGIGYNSSLEVFAWITNSDNGNIAKFLQLSSAALLFNSPHKKSELKKVLGVVNLKGVTSTFKMFDKCVKIQEVRISNLSTSLEIKDTHLLSYKSVQYMIENSTATSNITLTLHATALAVAEAAYIADSTQDTTTYPTLSDWALSKNIQIATS